MLSQADRAIYTGTFISTPILGGLQILENHAVGVDENGVIRHIAPLPSQTPETTDSMVAVSLVASAWGWGKLRLSADGEPRDEEETWSWKSGGNGTSSWWFPGFIDTHIHASQYPNAGVFGKTTLLDWLNTYTFPLEASLSDLTKARRVYSACVSRTLSHGTTTASYFTTRHVESTNLLADICLAKGQRAFIGRVCMDSHLSPEYYRDESPSQGVKNTQATIFHISEIDPQNELISPIITPRFAPACSSDLLAGLGKLASETNHPIQTHISENTSEITLVSSLFPDHDSYAHCYDFHGLLTTKTVLAHAIHLCPEERRLVKERESKISHCPVSNTSLSSGLCPVRELLDQGIEVGLGTDVSGGYSASILVAAREASMVSRTLAGLTIEDIDDTRSEEVEEKALPIAREAGPQVDAPKYSTSAKDRKKLSVEECLFLATRGGANCLNLGNKIGAFEIGMEFDAQLIELGEADDVDGAIDDGLVELWGKETWSEKVAKWLFCGDDRNTKTVYVKGKLVHERR